MAVMIGHACGDEHNGAKGGQAGDQTGKEVMTQNWYLNKKGWRVFRAKDERKAYSIAEAMRRACANDNIGYDQNERLTLYNAAKQYGFDPGSVKTPVETDCSALVRVCCAYAGIATPNFNTTIEPQTLLATGEFVELVGAKYTEHPDYLRTGDILCTPVQGHTLVILTDGPKAEYGAPETLSKEWVLGERTLRNGMVGEDVRTMQTGLISLGYNLGIWGADGEFGDCTDIAVRQFQEDNGLVVDGEFGPKSLAALDKALAAAEKPADNDDAKYHNVRIEGGSCWVRTAPNTEADKLGVVNSGQVLPYQGVTSENGWQLVEYKGKNGWVSGKYGRCV